MDTLGIVNLPVFLVAAVALTATPGPDTLYIVGRGLSQGRRAALYSVLGISIGLCIHALAAGLGISAVFAASAQAFTALKWAGAAYLVYLGIRVMRSARDEPSIDERALVARDGGLAILRQGMLTNLLNPKVALFYLAFLPQFVARGSAHYTLAFLALGGLFVLIGTAGNSVVALASGTAGALLTRHGSSLAWGRRLTGCVYIGLGVYLARARLAAL